MIQAPTAIIADDEPRLRSFLRRHLAGVWPELRLVGEAGSGEEALRLIHTQRPDAAFLDVKMPLVSGLEVARRMQGAAHVVFITAYDQFAVEAFENNAVDYLLKPVSVERLAKTVERLRMRMAQPPTDLSQVLGVLSELAQPKPAYLEWLSVAQRGEVVMIPVKQVDFFQASDKYTLAVATNKEWVIRATLKELETQLDPSTFWRVHRNTIVKVAAIARVTLDMRGHRQLHLHDHPRTLLVSRAYAERFKRM